MNHVQTSNPQHSHVRAQQRTSALTLLTTAVAAGPAWFALRSLSAGSWDGAPLAGTFGQLASVIWALIAAALLVAAFWPSIVAATHEAQTLKPFQRSVLALSGLVVVAHLLVALVLTRWTGGLVWPVLIAVGLYCVAAAGAYYGAPILVRDHADAGGFGTDMIGDRFANEPLTADPFANSAEIFFGN